MNPKKYLPNVVLIPSILLILYALPHSFTIPTTRIPLPFANNTAEATSIVLVSSFFIAAFYRLRHIPFFWRMCTTVSLSEIGFVFFEVIHVLNLHSFRIGYTAGIGYAEPNDFSFLAKNAMITIGILGILFVINIYAKTTQITNKWCLSFIFFILLTVGQLSRDWYNHPTDDPYTVLTKAVCIWMWLFLARRDKK